MSLRRSIIHFRQKIQTLGIMLFIVIVCTRDNPLLILSTHEKLFQFILFIVIVCTKDNPFVILSTHEKLFQFIFYFTFFNVRKFLNFEQREVLLARRKQNGRIHYERHRAHGFEMTSCNCWERPCRAEKLSTRG